MNIFRVLESHRHGRRHHYPFHTAVTRILRRHMGFATIQTHRERNSAMPCDLIDGVAARDDRVGRRGGRDTLSDSLRPRIDSRFIRERRGFESLGVTPVAEVLVADGVTSAAVSPNHRCDPATDEVLG